MKSNNFGTTEDLDPMLKADTERARRAEARQRWNIVIVDGRRSGQGEVLPSRGTAGSSGLTCSMSGRS